MARRSRCGTGAGRSSTPSTTLKSAVLAPMPSASVRIATRLKPGSRTRSLTPRRASSMTLIGRAGHSSAVPAPATPSPVECARLAEIERIRDPVRPLPGRAGFAIAHKVALRLWGVVTGGEVDVRRDPDAVRRARQRPGQGVPKGHFAYAGRGPGVPSAHEVTVLAIGGAPGKPASRAADLKARQATVGQGVQRICALPASAGEHSSRPPSPASLHNLACTL